MSPRAKAPKGNAKGWPLAALVLTLTTVNALLSHGNIPLIGKGFLLALGLLLPLILWARSTGAPRTTAAFDGNALPPMTLPLLFVLAALALGLRFAKLTTLFLYPTLDETNVGSFAIALTEKWDWRFFYTFGQVPPLPVWTTALLLKAGASPLFSFWFPSAVVSALTVVAGFFAAREFFPRSFALLAAGLLAFGYWPLLMGRVCHNGIWLPLWFCGCLYFLGRFLKAPGKGAAVRLGFAAGLGSFTFTPWPWAVLALLAAAFGGTLKRPLRNARSLPYFLVAFAVALAPFLLAVLREGYGQHIGAMSFLSGWFPFSHQGWTVLSYGTELLWGTFDKDTAYGAMEGGLLNPLWGSAFLIGAVQLWRDRNRGVLRWTALAFLLVMMPGVLSMNVEMFRVGSVMPLLLLVAALGLAQVLLAAPRSWRIALLTVFLLAGGVFDGWRIVRSQDPYLRKATGWVWDEVPLADLRGQALLKDQAASFGPGLVFTEFTEIPFDEYLFDMSYPFNAAENPKLKEEGVRWAGLVINAQYASFLKPRFPGSRWHPLGCNHPGEPEMALGILPVEERTGPTLALWKEAHHYFRSLSAAINSIREDRSYHSAEDLFHRKPAFLAEDPFLEACYWERRAEFFYQYDYRHHLEDQLSALRQAIQAGYPAAHLNYKLGCLLMRHREFQASRQALRAALRTEPGNQDVLDALTLLDSLQKGAPAPK